MFHNILYYITCTYVLQIIYNKKNFYENAHNYVCLTKIIMGMRLLMWTGLNQHLKHTTCRKLRVLHHQVQLGGFHFLDQNPLKSSRLQLVHSIVQKADYSCNHRNLDRRLFQLINQCLSCTMVYMFPLRLL